MPAKTTDGELMQLASRVLGMPPCRHRIMLGIERCLVTFNKQTAKAQLNILANDKTVTIEEDETGNKFTMTCPANRHSFVNSVVLHYEESKARLDGLTEEFYSRFTSCGSGNGWQYFLKLQKKSKNSHVSPHFSPNIM